jgi:hypothetical protein
MKSLKMAFCLLFFCLLVLPITAHGQEVKPIEKSLISKISGTTLPGIFPKRSLSINQSYYPGDYTLVTDGTYVDTLLDSYYSYQRITFETVSNYSSSQMNVQILYSSEMYYYKDPYLHVEFYKNNGGTLEYINSTEFDTSGSTNIRLNSLVDKSYYSGQQYIYLRVGVLEYSDDNYFSDYTQFKVANPFYTPPVVDKTPPTKPTVSAVSDKDTSVKGKAEAGSTVLVISGTTTVGTGTAYSDGTFSVTIANQKAGTKLTIYAKDKAGNTSLGTTVTVIDKTPPAKPTVYSVGDNQTIINGKAEASSKVVIKQGTTVLGQITASSTGYFTIKIVATKKAGTVLTAYATDLAGNQSTGTTVTVVDKTPPATAVVNKVTYQSTSVTGKAEAGCTIYIFKGSTLVGTIVADIYGNFKATIKPQSQGSSLEVIVMDKAGNQSKSVFVKVY